RHRLLRRLAVTPRASPARRRAFRCHHDRLQCFHFFPAGSIGAGAACIGAKYAAGKPSPALSYNPCMACALRTVSRQTREKPMTIQSLDALLRAGLGNLYDAGRRIARTLPRMRDASDSRELAALLDEHLEETARQVERLERAFDHLGSSPKRKV